MDPISNYSAQLKGGNLIYNGKMSQSNPIEVAEYGVANKLVEEAAFAWWVPQVLKRRGRIIGAFKSRYHKQMRTFGIELPKTVKRALEIDKETGTNFWEK